MVRLQFPRRICVLLILLLALLPSSSARSAEVHWSTDVEKSLQAANSKNTPILMQFTASWCVYCKRMEKTTFADPQLAERINQQYTAIQVDADKHKDLVKELQIKGLPALLVIAPDLTIIDRISGFQTAEALTRRLDDIDAVDAETQAIVKTPIAEPNAERAGFAVLPEVNQPKRTVQTREEIPVVDLFEGLQPAAESDPFATTSPPVMTDSEPSSERFQTISNVKVQSAASNSAIAKQPAAPPASFKGVCLVSAVEDRELVTGAETFALVYRGQVLYFKSAEHKARFVRTPDKYWPMLDGACSVTLAETGKQIAGDVQFAAVFRKRVWFFTSDETMQIFLADPAEMVEEALEKI